MFDERLVGMVGPREAPPAPGPASARGGRQGAVPDRLREAPLSRPRAGRPGMRRGSDVAAPPASHPVQSGRPRAASLPRHADPRAGGHQVSALREQRLPSPAPDLAPHPALPRSGRRWVGRRMADGDTGPEFLSFRALGILRRQRHEKPALLVGGSGPRTLVPLQRASARSCWRLPELC